VILYRSESVIDWLYQHCIRGCYLLAYNAVQYSESQLTFRRNIPPPFSESTGSKLSSRTGCALYSKDRNFHNHRYENLSPAILYNATRCLGSCLYSSLHFIGYYCSIMKGLLQFLCNVSNDGWDRTLDFLSNMPAGYWEWCNGQYFRGIKDIKVLVPNVITVWKQTVSRP
jgi:hypothetical protein